MSNCKAPETAEMSNEVVIFQIPEIGSVLEPDVICNCFTKHSIEGMYSNSEADTATDNIKDY